MAGSTNLVVPIVLWGRSPPAHCISTVYLLRDQRTMVTGSYDGQVRVQVYRCCGGNTHCAVLQIIIWQLDDTDAWNFTPRHMLIGHTAAVSCWPRPSSGLTTSPLSTARTSESRAAGRTWVT